MTYSRLNVITIIGPEVMVKNSPKMYFDKYCTCAFFTHIFMFGTKIWTCGRRLLPKIGHQHTSQYKLYISFTKICTLFQEKNSFQKTGGYDHRTSGNIERRMTEILLSYSCTSKDLLCAAHTGENCVPRNRKLRPPYFKIQNAE